RRGLRRQRADAGRDRDARNRAGAGDRARPDARMARPPRHPRRGRTVAQIGRRLLRRAQRDRGRRVKPLFVICEDGTEYLDRFERFLGSEFRFLRTSSYATLVSALGDGAAAGVVLDLDFRRTPRNELVDEGGGTLAAAAAGEQ